MDVFTNPTNFSYNYFLAIENDMEKMSRFVEFDEANHKTYSIELARILFAASAEVELVAKDICNLLKYPLPQNASINDWKKGLKPIIPALSQESVFIPKYGLTIATPFEKFTGNGYPDWWKGYNRVKHSRNHAYGDANLKNALLSLGGLLILIFYQERITRSTLPLHILLDRLQPAPSLFRFNPDYYVVPTFDTGAPSTGL